MGSPILSDDQCQSLGQHDGHGRPVLYSYAYDTIFSCSFAGPESFNILRGHSRATMFLICNNAAQGILSSFFFKYAGNDVLHLFYIILNFSYLIL